MHKNKNDLRPVIQKLPDEYLLLIGEAITAWSVLEHELKALTYLILGLGQKRGRVAVRSPRASEVIKMAMELMEIDGIESKTIDLQKFAKRLEEIENRRNTLAHNIWMETEDGKIVVQSLTGTWPATKENKRITRRINPAGIPVELVNLTDLVGATRSSIQAILELRQDILTQIGALPEKHREQVDPMALHYVKPKSPMTQPPTSQE